MDKKLLSLQYSFFLCLAIAEAIWGALNEKLYEKSGLAFLQLHKDCRTPCTFYNFWDENAPYHVKIIPKITSTCTTKINEDTAFQNYRRSFQNSFFSFFQPLIGKILIFLYKTRVVLIVLYIAFKNLYGRLLEGNVIVIILNEWGWGFEDNFYEKVSCWSTNLGIFFRIIKLFL